MLTGFLQLLDQGARVFPFMLAFVALMFTRFWPALLPLAASVPAFLELVTTLSDTIAFVLKDFAGTWQDVGPANRLTGSVCGGKPMPVTVQLSQKEGFAFTAFGISVSPQCPNLEVYVKPVDAKTMQGTVTGKHIDGEQKIRLVRTPQAPRRR